MSSTGIAIPVVQAEVKVARAGVDVVGARVYLFNGSGSYLGMSGETDDTGNVEFDIPADQDFLFRVDYLGSRYWSDTVNLAESGTVSVDTGGGVLAVTVQVDGDTPLVGVSTYLFDEAGSYLNLSATTDDTEAVHFDLPAGQYKLRADYLGYKFWTGVLSVSGDLDTVLEIPHTALTVTVGRDDGETPLACPDIPVYLFDENGSFLGVYVTTDENGQALLYLPEKPYKLRADYLSGLYWSDVFTWTDPVILISEGWAQVLVTASTGTVADAPVYVFSAWNDEYLGVSGTTDENGTVSFRLPQGTYDFKADYMSTRYASGDTEIASHTLTPVIIDAGGGDFVLTLDKGEGEALSGVTCFLFSGSGSYLDQSRVTNENGQAVFSLSNGTYQVRVDYMGYQFWTPAFSAPTAQAYTLSIPHVATHITVERNFDGDVLAANGIPVYLFTPAGSYLNISKTTDTAGGATFDLPDRAYKMRADYLSGQYWSGEITQTDTWITINEGQARVIVSSGTTPLENVPVYVFTAADAYLNINGTTGADGSVTFRLPQSDYRFRADHMGSQYWISGHVTAHATTDMGFDPGGGAFTLTVQKGPGEPLSGIPVYVFNASGSYLGISGSTATDGTVSFDLTDGSYKFRADLLGGQFFTDTVTLPGTLSFTHTIPHADVTALVQKVYGAQITPLSGTTVYLFTEAGSYMGVSATTDGSGQAMFSLPAISYKLRADHLSQQYWSTPFVQTGVTIEVPYSVANVHVTDTGADVAGARVFVFNGTSAYLGIYGDTDTYGIISFDLPAGTYRFRADVGGSQYWTEAVSLIAHQENQVNMPLDLLALTLHPSPDKIFHGQPPKAPEMKKHAKDPVLLASIGSLTGILANLSQTQLPGAVYYFINDHLGTPAKVVDDDGTVVWDADYLPFGETNVLTGTFDNNFRFPGQYLDDETGWHYNYYRYYDPGLGRYLKSDPIRLFGGINTYIYTVLSG